MPCCPRRDAIIRFLAAVFGLLVLPLAAAGQSYPTLATPGIIDQAEMIAPEAEARLMTTLAALAADTGVQMAVVTLPSLAMTDGASLAAYATGLFNAAGTGGADTNDGVMPLVFRDDRQPRITLGSGYDAAAKDTARAIVSDTILPAMRCGDASAAIESGVAAIVARIVMPARGPDTAPPLASDCGGNALWWIGGVVIAAIAGLVGLNRRAAATLRATPCPACGKTGLSKSSVTLQEATETTPGKGETRTTCAACGHVTAVTYVMSARAKPAAAAGGGQSGGDGASGKW